MTTNQRIKQHKDFWTIMYGVDTWTELTKDVKTKDPEKILGLLDEILDKEIGERLTEISIFKDVEDTEPKPFPLEFWLYQTLNPDKDVEENIELFRETFDKSIKLKLPCCTVSASFEGYRNLENIKKKNNFICIDVDRFTKLKRKKSNDCIDMQLVKELFMRHPSTVYTGFSCSGDGVYAIIKIYDGERLDEYFDFFREKFNHLGINIDDSCRDYTRLRFLSVDREGYFNPKAKAYKIADKVVEKKNVFQKANEKSNREKIELLCAEIDRQNHDITQSYEDWLKVGASLYNEFGDSGAEYFHRISKHHPDYSMKETEKKFNQCKKMKSIKLSTLFFIATSYGIRY